MTDFEENRRRLNSSELIAERIGPGLRKGHEHFALSNRDLIGAFGSADIDYLLERLGPGWKKRSTPREEEHVITREISADEALSQIHQRVGPAGLVSGRSI